MYLRTSLVSLTMGLLFCPQVGTADEPTGQDRQPGVQSTFLRPQRASHLLNLAVKDAQGQSIGSIHDMVLDPANGEIRYVAVSFGGLLGMGDKLFAVPWDALQFRSDRNGHAYFLFDVTEEAMQAAPGFDQDNWPDFANQKWDADVTAFYRHKLRRVPHTESPNSP